MSDLPPLVLKSEVLALGALTGVIDLVVTIGREAGLPDRRVLELLEALSDRYAATLAAAPGRAYLLEEIARLQAALPRAP